MLAWDNYVDRVGVVLSASSEAAGTLGVRNLIDPSPSIPWRSLPVSTPHWLEFNLGSLRPVNVVAFAQWRDGMMLQPGDTVRLVLRDDGAAVAYDTGAVAWGGDPWAGYWATIIPEPVPARTVRIEIGTANPYVQIGRLWIAEAWQPRLNFAFDWSTGLLDDSKTIRAPRSGIRFTDPRTKRRQVALSLSWLDPEESEALRGGDILAGSSRQVLVCPRPAQWARDLMFGVSDQVSPLINPNFDLWTKAIQITEDN